jgi:hypothetical protein
MIGVALLIVAVVGGYCLTGGRSAAPPPTTVTGKRSGSSVKFSWDYSAALSSDTYRWEVVGGRSGIVSTPAVTIPAPAGTRVCLRVIVVRADGSNASKNWSPEGCTG